MKKRIFAITTAILLTTSVTFASNIKPVPDEIISQLHQAFKGVSNEEWKTTSNLYKATFSIDGHSLEAFYAFDGRFIGVSRKISVDDLPLILIKEVKEKASANQITDLFELLTDRGTEYFITYGSGKEQKIYKSNGNSWSRYKANDLNQGS